MDKNEVAEALERLREQLPETPAWIALITFDGEFIAGTKSTPQKDYGEEKRFGPILSAFGSLTERVHHEIDLGVISSTYTVGKSGILLIWPLESGFLGVTKFGKEKSISQLSVTEAILQSEIGKLGELLRESIFKRYSP